MQPRFATRCRRPTTRKPPGVYAGTIRHSRSPGRPASPSSMRGTRPIRTSTKMSLLKELGPSKLTETGRDLHRFAAELYPICRSITGDGLRRTLASIQNRIPLEIREVPSGTPVFDWTVPKEWNIRDAYIRNSAGRKVVDFQLSNLHVLNYSVPVHATLPLSELRPH